MLTCIHVCACAGPSFVLDTACSSSLLALDRALQSIRNGDCDAAIVGGCGLLLKPGTSLQFLQLGMLSPDGKCKSFDASGELKIKEWEDNKTYYSIIIHCFLCFECDWFSLISFWRSVAAIIGKFLLYLKCFL